MKTAFKLLLFCLVLLNPAKNLSAQDVSAGAGINFLAGSPTQSFGFGLNLMNEYRAFSKYGIRLHAGFIISGLTGSEYAASDSYTFSSFEGSFIYYLNSGKTQPYAGIGAGYYLPHPDHSSNAIFSPSLGEYMAGNYIEDNFGMNFLAGMRFSSQSFVSYNIELKYIYLKPTWAVHVIGKNGNYDLDLGRINLNTLIINFSLAFNF